MKRHRCVAEAPRFCLFVFLLLLALPCSLQAQLSTSDHLADPGFWPTKPNLARSDYVGASVCASCHAEIFAAQTKTSMARTAQHANTSAILAAHPKLSFTTGPYHYEISSQTGNPTYSIHQEAASLKATLAWAFGTGRVGQSFLFKAPDGATREAKVTYFSSLNSLDFTPARAFTSAASLDEAFYRQVSKSELARCFGCHTTSAMVDNQVEEKGLMPGVTCEACHGPGSKHVSVMQASAIAGTSYSGPSFLANPASLNPNDSVDFCGACHATWWDVKLTGTKGATNARSQPYRLEMSKCWGSGDSRLTCMGCHDPHYQLNQNASSYDHICFSCHAGATAAKPEQEKAQSIHLQKACPVATKDCTSCHMPKVLVPEMHYKFTDHKIQIAQPNAPYKE